MQGCDFRYVVTDRMPPEQPVPPRRHPRDDRLQLSRPRSTGSKLSAVVVERIGRPGALVTTVGGRWDEGSTITGRHEVGRMGYPMPLDRYPCWTGPSTHCFTLR